VFKRRKPEDSRAAEPASATLPGQSGAPSAQGAMPASPADTSAAPADNGLGVPPFRPVPPKEAPAMGRSPFTTMPGSGSAPGTTPATPPAMPPGAAPRPGAPMPRPAAERRTLVVGRGISVQGTVQDAERLVVEGTVEASMIHATELAISPGGVFKGEVEVEEAEVAGTIDGTLTARASLIVRATGRVLGTARCRRLQVEDGGQITGRIEMITEGAAPKPAEAPRAAPEA
jgi:cytoskeletal protein CcmA (bactofilin family)